MDSKDEYITQMCRSILKISNKNIKEIETHIRKFMDDNYMILCKDTTQEKQPTPEVRNRNIPVMDMYYVEFGGHVYLADKKNRVYTCNKINPVEIGHIQENEHERILVKYPNCQQY